MLTGRLWGQVMEQQVRLTHEVDRRVTVTTGDQTLVTYHYGDIDRFPYCHPVSLPGGPPITLCRPFDHPWHLGLFFAWKYVNGINVWEGPDAREAYGRSRHVAMDLLPQRGIGAGFRHTIDWVTSDEVPLLRDRRTVLVSAPREQRSYSIDWFGMFTALVEEVVLDRKVEWGGYAGLSVRLPRSFLQPNVRNADGQTSTTDTHQACSRWTDYSGWIDGLPGKVWGGLTMIDHPQNPRYPTAWLTYDRPQLQFLNAAFVRDEPYILHSGQTLRLAYRLLVHWGVGDPAVIEAEADRFGQVDLDSAAEVTT